MKNITLLPQAAAADKRRLFDITYDTTEQKGRVHISCRIERFVPGENRTDTTIIYLSPKNEWIPLFDYDYADPQNGYADRETADAYLLKLLTTPLAI